MQKGYEPDQADFEAALLKRRLGDIKITSLKEVDLPKTEGTYEVYLSGLA